MALATTEFAVPDKIRAVEVDDDPELLRHVKRPQWGLAILAWEKGDTRSYQFEDGRLRTFKRGYYDLMQPGTSERRLDDDVVRDLQAALGGEPAERRLLEPVAPFAAQVDLFERMFPGGFQGEKWTEEHRGLPEGRVLKRHRDASLEKARSELSADGIGSRLVTNDFAGVAGAVLETFAATSLVSAQKVKALRRMDEAETKRFAEAAADLMHGDDDLGPRFKNWVAVLRDVLGGKPSWKLTTVLLALTEPDEHVCVRHSVFIRQAAVVAPTSKYTRRPRVRAYRNFRRVAQGTRTRLEAAGHEPRDLLDVHDFIWATLRNSSLEHLGSD